MYLDDKSEMVSKDTALRGRQTAMPVDEKHAVLGSLMRPPFPEGLESLLVGMGCFWGAEKQFWTLDGVYSTQVGYSGGYTVNPLYEEVCTGKTGHSEVVRVVFDPRQVDLATVLRRFWENHDPTQGMRQGNDLGTQYRSAVYFATEPQRQLAIATRDAYQSVLTDSGYGRISTEVAPAGDFYYAESYHQQYLHKNPQGYCGLGGTGVGCPIGNFPKQ